MAGAIQNFNVECSYVYNIFRGKDGHLPCCMMLGSCIWAVGWQSQHLNRWAIMLPKYKVQESWNASSKRYILALPIASCHISMYSFKCLSLMIWMSAHPKISPTRTEGWLFHLFRDMCVLLLLSFLCSIICTFFCKPPLMLTVYSQKGRFYI